MDARLGVCCPARAGSFSLCVCVLSCAGVSDRNLPGSPSLLCFPGLEAKVSGLMMNRMYLTIPSHPFSAIAHFFNVSTKSLDGAEATTGSGGAARGGVEKSVHVKHESVPLVEETTGGLERK
eukprot:752240-Hanusia_phi.AAC.3